MKDLHPLGTSPTAWASVSTVAAILLFPGATPWVVWSETNGRVPAPLIVGLILTTLVLLVTRPLRWR